VSLSKETYLLDTNTLITPSRSYYSFNIAPRFWAFLQDEIVLGNLIVMDMVAEEISKGKDILSNWLKTINVSPLDRRSSDILICYGKILTHIQESDSYTDRALALWAKDDHADPWIVAAAAARKFTIITFEKPSLSSLGNNKTSKPKIPDVCREFGVNCIDIFSFLEIKNFSFPI